MSSSLRPAVPACMGKHVLLKVCWLKLIYSLNMKYTDAPARWDSSNIFIISSPFSQRLFMAGICSRDSCVALGTALLMSATFVWTEMSLYLFDGLRWMLDRHSWPAAKENWLQLSPMFFSDFTFVVSIWAQQKNVNFSCGSSLLRPVFTFFSS